MRVLKRFAPPSFCDNLLASCELVEEKPMIHSECSYLYNLAFIDDQISSHKFCYFGDDLATSRFSATEVPPFSVA